MNRVARMLLGTATGLLLVGLGLDLLSWRFWVITLWVLAHSQLWSYLDERQFTKETK